MNIMDVMNPFDCLKRFVRVIWTCFELIYLTQPIVANVKKQMKINEMKRFFMSILIDYIHESRKNCPMVGVSIVKWLNLGVTNG
jgi:hypothetical protein